MAKTLQRDDSPPANIYEAIGHFVTSFATAERMLVEMLYTLSGMPRRNAKALLSGSTRADTASSLLRRLASVSKWEQQRKKDLDRALSHLSVITKARNNLLHFGGKQLSKDKLLVSNKIAALTKDHIEDVRLSTKDFMSMTTDLAIIYVHLVHVLYPNKFWTDEKFDEPFRQFPWLYTPPQPKPNHRKTRENARTRARPRPS